MALVTAAEVRLHLPEVTGTGEDTNLSTLITRCGVAFARRCGYPPSSPSAPPSMESRSYVLDLTGDGSRELDLTVYPVASITSASVDDAADFEGDEDAVAAADMVLRDGRRIRLDKDSASSWTRTPGGNRVTFVAGFGGSSTVSGAHNASVTTITVASTAQFVTHSAGGGRVVVGSEVILFTAKTATTLTGCTRGAEGTTAASIANGDAISQPIPDDLKELCILGVVHFWRMRKRQSKESTTENAVTTSFRDEAFLPDFVEAGLGHYMLPRAVA